MKKATGIFGEELSNMSANSSTFNVVQHDTIDQQASQKQRPTSLASSASSPALNDKNRASTTSSSSSSSSTTTAAAATSTTVALADIPHESHMLENNLDNIDYDLLKSQMAGQPMQQTERTIANSDGAMNEDMMLLLPDVCILCVLFYSMNGLNK